MIVNQYQDQNLTVFESALYRTTTTLLHTPKFNFLVDPNWLPGEIAGISARLSSLGDLPLVMLFTHSDYDHIIGYRAFQPQIVVASQAFVESPDREKNLRQIREFDDQHYILRPYPIDYPEVDFAVKTDGQTLTLGGVTFTFYLAPGHTADGIFTVIEPGGIFIAGDYLCNVEFPFIYHSSEAYLSTLHKVETILQLHQIRLMVPGHGDVTTNTEEIRRRMQSSLEYVKTLREAVSLKKEMDAETWLKRYDFPLGLRKAHLSNLALVQEECRKPDTTPANDS